MVTTDPVYIVQYSTFNMVNNWQVAILVYLQNQTEINLKLPEY